MEHIEPALHHVDMWNMNLGEAARIFLGETIEKPDELPEGAKIGLLQRIEEQVWKHIDPTERRPRMFTISDRKGCFVIYKEGNCSFVRSEYCPSPCADIGARDKTGAGDVRFGVQRFFLAREKAQEWKDGTMSFDDAKLAVQIGQIASTLQVQGKEADAFRGVTLAAIERVARSGEEFPFMELLLNRLRRSS
jgi:sugar/nucleoside kinase (ribokinase family)